MIKVDVKSHFAMKRDKECNTDYDYNHTIRISVKDYWNNIEDFWDVNFVSKSKKNDTQIFVTRSESPITWIWK